MDSDHEECSYSEEFVGERGKNVDGSGVHLQQTFVDAEGEESWKPIMKKGGLLQPMVTEAGHLEGGSKDLLVVQTGNSRR